MRNYSLGDQGIFHLDQMLRTLWGKPQSQRACPAPTEASQPLAEADQRLVAQLMRINHTGEVCAQALYQGQAITARTPSVRESLAHAAEEENDHLNWTRQRLDELNARPSLLNPLFYGSSLMIGVLNGALGDRWNLGFVAETERQVVAHLDRHLQQLPSQDQRSRAILQQMRVDEQHHEQSARHQGGMSFPAPVRSLMTGLSKIMTNTTRWL